MTFAGVVAGALSYDPLASLIPRESTRFGVAWIITGVTLAAIDLICRFRATDPAGTERLFSNAVGGAMKGFPVWVLGGAAIILGILLAMRII
jgi:hypothetical protein